MRSGQKEALIIKDSLSYTVSLSPTVYLDKYLENKKKYLESNSEIDLIHTYIYLQIFIENHVSYYIRGMIGGSLCQKIQQYNERYFLQSAKNKDGKIKILCDHVNYKNWREIEDPLKEVTKVRNHLLHGHPIEQKSSGETSSTKDMLTREYFLKILDSSELLAREWNSLIDFMIKKKVRNMPLEPYLKEAKFKFF